MESRLQKSTYIVPLEFERTDLSNDVVLFKENYDHEDHGFNVAYYIERVCVF